jgi:ubiquinone/menaquinone biosynthesis C-methylase UbiE
MPIRDFKALLRKVVRPSARILVVGPGTVKADPSTYFLSNRVRKHGKAIVLDVKRKPEGCFIGYGGLEKFRKTWKSDVRRVPPALVSGNACEPPFKDGVFDVVYEHHSMPFIAPFTQQGGVRYPLIKKVISEYARMVKPGGKVIIADPDTVTERVIRKEAKRLGVKVEVVRGEEGFEGGYRVRKKIMKPFHDTWSAMVLTKTA